MWKKSVDIIQMYTWISGQGNEGGVFFVQLVQAPFCRSLMRSEDGRGGKGISAG